MKIFSKCMWNSRSWEKDIVKKLEKLESSGIHLIVMYQCWFLNFFSHTPQGTIRYQQINLGAGGMEMVCTVL